MPIAACLSAHEGEEWQVARTNMKKTLKRIWHFIWEDNSALSWAVNIILAFILIKFLVYPGLGLAVSTPSPVVAVVSGSMEHDAAFNDWWASHSAFYESLNITKAEFSSYRFSNGFNKGDLMLLRGKPPAELRVGDTIVFIGNSEPIIHRLVSKTEKNGRYYLSTKGDNNEKQHPYEIAFPEDKLIGQAVIRIPLLGYVKIAVTEALSLAK